MLTLCERLPGYPLHGSFSICQRWKKPSHQSCLALAGSHWHLAPTPSLQLSVHTTPGGTGLFWQLLGSGFSGTSPCLWGIWIELYIWNKFSSLPVTIKLTSRRLAVSACQQMDGVAQDLTVQPLAFQCFLRCPLLIVFPGTPFRKAQEIKILLECRRPEQVLLL